MPNVIRSIATDDEFGTQSIRMIVTSNERGAQGPQGEPGEAATIAAGQAYSVEPGQSPAVMNTGTSSAAVFDFYIPKGEKGDQGEPGPAGADEWGEITGNIADQTDLQNALNGKQNKLTAGSNITISGDTISATNTTYTAGNGLNLNHGEFSVNTGAIQEKLTAGTNVDITGNTISATDTTYTAGTGLALNGTEFSVDTDTIQSKLTAGSNVQINGNTISATDTTYTAGNAITIDSGNNNAINAAIDPADFFTSTESKLTGTGTSVALTPTAGLPLSSVQLKGDTTQQTYSGKNLLNVDSSYTISNIYQTKSISLASGGTYTLQIDNMTTNGSGESYITIRGNGSTLKDTYISNTNKSYTFTLTANADEMYIYADKSYSSSQGKTTTFTNMMISMGPSITQYEPYTGGIPAPNPDYPQTINTVTGRQVVTISDGDQQSQSYEVNLGKNLWNPAKLVAGYGLYDYNGTTYSSSARSYLDYTEVRPSTAYTMSGAAIMVICFYDSSKTYISGISTPSASITTPANAAYVRVSINNGADYSQAQLELGSTATTYAPYFTPIELCKIGDYQDYIYKSGDDWYLHKAVGKALLNGSESGWAANTPVYYLPKTAFTGLSFPQSTTQMLSNYFNAEPVWDNLKIGGFFSGATAVNFDYDGTGSDLAGFKTWLGNNNVSVYAPLATATDTQITNADLVAQLNALAGATTYDGQTVITVTSDNQLAILDLGTYRKSLAGIISAIKEL